MGVLKVRQVIHEHCLLITSAFLHRLLLIGCLICVILQRKSEENKSIYDPEESTLVEKVASVGYKNTLTE